MKASALVAAAAFAACISLIIPASATEPSSRDRTAGGGSVEVKPWISDVGHKLGSGIYLYLYDGSKFYVCGVSSGREFSTKFWDPYADKVVTLDDKHNDGRACPTARRNLSYVNNADVTMEIVGEHPSLPVENSSNFSAALHNIPGHSASGFINGASIQWMEEDVPNYCWPAIHARVKIRYVDGSEQTFFLLKRMQKADQHVVDPPGTAYEPVPCGSVAPGQTVSQLYEMAWLESLDLMDGTALWAIVDELGDHHLYRVRGKVQSGRIGERFYVLSSRDVLGPLTENQWINLPAAKRYEKLVDLAKSLPLIKELPATGISNPGAASKPKRIGNVRSRG